MMAILRKLAGLSDRRETLTDEAFKPDKQSADVAIASQRVSERTNQVRATLAELLKANDGKNIPSIRGLE